MSRSLRNVMKPLFIIDSNRWGGAELVAFSDIIDLAHDGVEVTVYCPQGSLMHAAVTRAKTTNSRIKAETYISKSDFFDVQFTRSLKTVMDRSGINIIHIHDDDLLFSVVPALFNRKKISLILSRHTPVEEGLINWIMWPLYARVDFLTVISDIVRQTSVRRLPLANKKIRVVNLGLDFNKFDPIKVNARTLRESWGADKDTIVVGSVGRLDEEVGQTTLLNAAAGLMKNSERKMRFVIVGEDPLVASDEYLQSLRGLVSIFHIENVVTFSSLGDNLPEVMSAFDIFVMPGREEVPGLGALEALAMERSVVLSRVPGAEEVVGLEEFGMLCRPEDGFDLQKKILHLLDNPSTRLTMGVNGRKYVLRHYDKRIRLTRLLDIYGKSLRRRHAVP